MKGKIFGLTICTSEETKEGVAILKPKRSAYIRNELDLFMRACVISWK